MVTAWVIKRLNRFGIVVQTIEFYGDAMTQKDLERHYSGDADNKLLLVKQVDAKTAFNMREKHRGWSE